MICPAPYRLGISAVATHLPAWSLSNAWFGDAMPRKFVHHTGIESRPISWEGEAVMAQRAIANLVAHTGCDLRDCAGLIFVSPSFVPIAVARHYLDAGRLENERLYRAARHVVRRLGIADCPVTALNWFCSGYSKALAIACRRAQCSLRMSPHQFLIIATASRISRITDYGNPQTAPLFGDMATATLLTRMDNPKHPPHFEVLFADAEKQRAGGVFFNFELHRDVLLPTFEGGREVARERLVYSLDGMGIADAAPRAMSSALGKALDATGIGHDDVRFVVPHQAGTGIVRLTSLRLEQMGIRGEVVNGLTSRVGNVSSSSIPFALHEMWPRLDGVIACPTAAVGEPGQPEVSQGCVLLQTTSAHRTAASAA
jgi:3-oxoacyl-[acyl-carrier-protein] synthase III